MAKEKEDKALHSIAAESKELQGCFAEEILRAYRNYFDEGR